MAFCKLVLLGTVLVSSAGLSSRKAVKVHLESRGCAQCDGSMSKLKENDCPKASLNIGGEEYVGHKRPGIWMVAIDNRTRTKEGGVQYIAQHNKLRRLRMFSRSLVNGDIVLIVSYQACNMSGDFLRYMKGNLDGLKDKTVKTFGSIIGIYCFESCAKGTEVSITLPYFYLTDIGAPPITKSFDIVVKGDVPNTKATAQPSTVLQKLITPSVFRNTTTSTANTGANVTTNNINTNKWKSENWLFIGAGCGGAVFLIIVIAVLVLIIRKRSRGQKMMDLGALRQDNSHRCSKEGQMDGECYYESVKARSLRRGNPVDLKLTNGKQPLISKEADKTCAEVYDDLPTPVRSVSPSKSALLLEVENDYLNEGDVTSFAKYVQFTKDGDVYKKPSNVAKFSPPTEQAPKLERIANDDADYYVDMNEHIYTAPSSSPDTPLYEDVRHERNA